MRANGQDSRCLNKTQEEPWPYGVYRMQLTAAAVTPPAEHAARRPAGAEGAAAADADVESVEKVIFEEKKEKAENHNLYIKSELQKESFCRNGDLRAFSTDSLE